MQGAEGRAGQGEGAGSCEGPPSLAPCPTEDLGPKEHVSGESAQEAAEGSPGSTRCVLARWQQGLTLPQLLYSKFTEYLEDYHVWASAHSRPSGRGPLHTPRLSVTFALLCAHACVAALVVATGHEQVGPFLTVALVSQRRDCFRTQGLGNWCSEGGYRGRDPVCCRPVGTWAMAWPQLTATTEHGSPGAQQPGVSKENVPDFLNVGN